MWAYLLLSLGISLAINIVLFIVAFRRHTDRLTDASYALTFIVLAAQGLAIHAKTRFHWLLFTMILLWALRLGGFLLFRIWRTGTDSRFDDIRNNFKKFGTFWVGQALSVWVILIPSLLAFGGSSQRIGGLAWAGLLVWLAGLAIETTADIQKYRFNRDPTHKGQWIQSGIWHYSRHPNYLGEIMVWVGTYVVACEALTGVQRIVGLAGPLFISCLLLFISGIPPLEKSADQRWGSIAAYREYKRRTSVLLLLPRKK